MDSESRKAINFDLDTKTMKKLGVYPQGYGMLKKTMKEFGFKHRQWSGYVSKDKLDNDRVISILKKIVRKNLWLISCKRKIDITNIDVRCYDATADIDDVLNELKAEAKENTKLTIAKENTKLTIDKADEAVIERIHNSKYGETFDILASGKSSVEERKADRQVMNMLAFFTDRNPEQMIRIYKSTALYSEEKGESYVFSIVMQTIDNASQIKTAPNKTQHVSKINSNENAK